MRVGYCLNAEEYEKYRLLKSGGWRACEDGSALDKDDFITFNKKEIIKLQQNIDKIYVDGIEKAVGSQWNSPFDDYLDFNVYAFRNDYPDPPDRKQLENVLKERDKSRTNILVLKVDGSFELYAPSQLKAGIMDPGIVLQYDAYYFNNGNGYANNIPQRRSYADYVDDLYSTGIFYWKEHLITKNIHYTPGSFKVYTLDQLLDVFSELNQIRDHWVSDFKDYDMHNIFDFP
jgi:hypothetical protein